jgi:PAS domain S-box-containing protein
MIQYGPRTSADRILRASIAWALLLGAFFVAMFLLGQATHVIPGTASFSNWFVPLTNSFLCPVAFSIAVLALGRYRVLRDPVSYWTGVGFVVAGVGLFCWILARPGILPAGQTFIGSSLSTPPRVAVSWFTLFALCLLAGVVFDRPRDRDLSGWRWPAAVLVWILLMILITIAAVVWEDSLPALVDEPGVFKPIYKMWVAGVGLAYGMGAVLSLRHYRRTGDALLGYVTFVQVSITFTEVMLVAGGQRYGYLFLGSRLLLIGSFVTVLIGLLAGYVELFRREQEKTRQLTARSAELLSILESIPVGVFVTDESGTVRVASRTGMAMFGATGFEQIRASQIERTYSKDVGQCAEDLPLTDVSRGKVIRNEEVQIGGQLDGKPRWALLSGGPIVDEKGGPLGGLLIATDISERKATEERVVQLNRDLDRYVKELESVLREKSLLIQEKSVLLSEVQEREERFHALADHMAQLAWMADGSGRVFWCNSRWIEFTGVRLEGSPAWEWDGIIHPDYAEHAKARLLRSVSSGELWEDVFPIRGTDGTFRWFLSRAHAIRDRWGEIIRWFGTSTDITQQKKNEEALRRSNEDIQQFAYIATHDMREPLRNVSNYAQLLARSYSDDRLAAERHRSIEVIVSSARRMEALISSVLQYARIASDGNESRVHVDLNEVLGETLGHLQSSVKDSLAEVRHGDLPTVFANRAQMVQLLQNLIGNSIKYRHPDRPPHIVISAEARVDQWLFTVRDNGQGFKQEYAEKIFGIFKRLHGAEVEGTGIGLAVCKAVVEGHGGSIWASGRPGEGAEFCFTLPRNP